MVNRNSPSKFKSNEVDAAMPVSSEGLRTTDEAGIGQRIRRTADNDETLTKNLFPGQFIHGIFSYWPELLVILLVKFLLCYFGILTGLIERCSYFARDLCPKYWPELLVTPLVNFLLCYEPFPTGVKQRDQPTTIDPTSGSRFTNKWKEVSNEFELVFAGDAEPECSLSITSRRLISNQKEYPSTYIAISGIPNFFDRDLSPNLFLIDRSAYQSHVLESYFYPEITENGTLPSLGIIRMTCVGNIPIFYDPFELLGSDWAFSLLQDLNFCLLTSSLRYLESQKNINFSKEALGIPSSWHSACIACFMPDAGNTPLLEGCLELFESQKKFVQIFYGPLLLSTQERQHDNPSLEDSHASQSHVLEPYFHPEITEVGTLPSLGAMRATCVANILISDVVGQNRRDFEERAWAAFLQGYRRDFTAASHVDTLFLQDFCHIVTDGECSTPTEIAAEYLTNRALIIHSRKPASAERRKRHRLLRRSTHLLAEVTLVSRQKDLLVV